MQKKVISVKFGKIIGYHNRLLLLHIIGPISFVDNRTYKGITYSSFKRSSNVTHLDVSEWIRSLKEASVFPNAETGLTFFSFCTIKILLSYSLCILRNVFCITFCVTLCITHLLHILFDNLLKIS